MHPGSKISKYNVDWCGESVKPVRFLNKICNMGIKKMHCKAWGVQKLIIVLKESIILTSQDIIGIFHIDVNHKWKKSYVFTVG